MNKIFLHPYVFSFTCFELPSPWINSCLDFSVSSILPSSWIAQNVPFLLIIALSGQFLSEISLLSFPEPRVSVAPWFWIYQFQNLYLIARLQDEDLHYLDVFLNVFLILIMPIIQITRSPNYKYCFFFFVFFIDEGSNIQFD